MDNKYLRDRARRRSRIRRDSMEHRRDYKMDHARRRGRNYDRYDYSESDYMGAYMATPGHMAGHYDRHHEHGGQYMYPTAYEVGHYIYGPDGRDYDDAHEYHKDLEEWMHKLKRHDRFGLPKDEVIKKAQDMGVKFHNYDEMEFYVVYLMLISDFKHIANDPHQYLAMAKEWLEDDDIQRKGSEKVCAYLYTIVLGEEDED